MTRQGFNALFAGSVICLAFGATGGYAAENSGRKDIVDTAISAEQFKTLVAAVKAAELVDVLRGPGIGFSKLVGPFSLHDDVIQLSDARAFSASLGLTLKGRLDLDAERMDMEGTIVPAYFFNSMLGNVPLVGKLFSPERTVRQLLASGTPRLA